jgi:microcystin-dependent protein
MPLETATHINDLVVTNPANSDGLNQADDHMRMIKQVLLTDIGNAMTDKKLTTVDGSSSVPAHGFAADATAGFYRSGTGVTGIVGSLIGQGTIDIGFLGIYAGSAVPTGYLACDGQAVSRTTYAALYAKIGNTWGAGDGSTTFNVPPLNNRFLRHRDGAGAAGAVGTLQGDQNKTHTHPIVGSTGAADRSLDHLHTGSGTTGSMNRSNPHSHPMSAVQAVGGNLAGGGAFGLTQSTNTGATDINHEHPFSFTSNGADRSIDHLHGINFTSGGGSADGAEARPLSATLLICIRAL